MKPIVRMMLTKNSRASEDGRNWDERRDEWKRRREYPDDRRYVSHDDGRYMPRTDKGYEGAEMEDWYPSSHEHAKSYYSSSEHPRMEDMNHHQKHEGSDGQKGSVTSLNKETAEKWAEHMQNEDGSTGPHWTLEQTKQLQIQKGIDCEPLEFWLALNATYSDLSKVFKKYGIANIDAYVDFAKAFWLDDKDAQPNKLARYYEYVVKH